MNNASPKACPRSYFPDGLDDPLIERLIAEAARAVAEAPEPTSALLDGTAAERCRRRTERRALGEVVRTLPVRSIHPSRIEDIAS